MKKGIVFFLVLLGSNVAFAGPTFEPQLGYVIGSTTDQNGISGSAQGLGFGAKLATDFLEIFSLGVDFHYSLPSYSVTGSAPSVSGNHWALGATADLTVPTIGLIFRLGYFFLDQLNLSSATYSGSALKIGLGYKLLPFLTANLDYILHTLGKLEQAGTTTTLSTAFKDNVWMISVSSPLVIPF